MTPVAVEADTSPIGGTAFLGENPRRAKTIPYTSILRVAGHVSREGHWGWDGASLEYVPGIAQDPAQADENTYRYCFNSPLTFVDPTGLMLWWPTANGVITEAVRARNRSRYSTFFPNLAIKTVVTALGGDLAAIPAANEKDRADIAMFFGASGSDFNC